MQEILRRLYATSHEHRENLSRIIGTSSSSPEELVSEFRRLNCVAGEHALRELFGSEETYEEILTDVCKRIGAIPSMYVEQLEANIAARVASTVHNHGGSHLYDWAKVGGAATALLIGRAGGFTTYMLATSTLRVVMGPLGWAALAVYGIHTLAGGVEDDKLVPAILYIASLRNEPA